MKRKSSKELLEELRVKKEWEKFKPTFESLPMTLQAHLLGRALGKHLGYY